MWTLHKAMNDRQNSRTAKANILVVEDDSSVATMMADLLTHTGCNAQTAWNAERAMRLAHDGDFSLITLDIDLPGANGFEICRRLKEDPRLCHTPVVFVTGRPHEEDQQRARGLGAVDYITKPFDALNFASRILSHVKAGGISN
jgi:DNA-binding response OmpR family regulator